MFRLTTLGALDLRDGHGRPVRDVLAQPKRVALLVWLALEERKGAVSRDRLLAHFWPESDDTRARNALSQALHHLRQALGSGVLESRGAGAIGFVAGALWCDAVEFARALEQGDRELALDLYRGEFCPSLAVSGTPDFEHWLDGRRLHLRSLAFAASRTLGAEQLQRGETAAAARTARHALALQPDDDADVRLYLGLLDSAGDTAGALAAYREHAHRLAAIEAEPELATREFAAALKARPAAVVTPAAAAATAATSPAAAAAAAPSPAAAPRRRRWWWASTAAAALVLLAVASQRRPAAAASDRNVAVFPFAVRGAASHAYLAEGMVDLLATKLEGVAGVRATDPRATIALSRRATREPGELEQVARQLGATAFITGEVTGTAGQLQLAATLHSVESPRVLATATAAGDSAALFELVDALAGQLLASLASGRDTVLTRLAAVSTSSLNALRAFLEGERALRAGQDTRAVFAFREAATLDTTFALAQFRLALASTWAYTREAEDPNTWIARAERNAHRLPPTVRDLFTAYGAYRDGRSDEAEHLFRSLTIARPDNIEAWFLLGETLFHWNPRRGRSPEEAALPLERTLQLDRGHSQARLHLAHLAAIRGDSVSMAQLASDFAQAHPDADRALDVRALLIYFRNDLAGRRLIAREAAGLEVFQLVSLLTEAVAYVQNLEAAMDLVPAVNAVASPWLRAFLARVLNDLTVAGGGWPEPAARTPPDLQRDLWQLESEALLASEPSGPVPLERAAELRRQVAAVRNWPAHVSYVVAGPAALGDAMRSYLLGRLSARLGDTAAVARHLAELRQAATPLAADMAYGLRAAMARQRGDLTGALAPLQRLRFAPAVAFTELPAHWASAERYATAEVLFALGRHEEALAAYESMVMLVDMPFYAPAHLRRAELYALRGDRERVLFHFGRAEGLWRAATPDYRAIIERARAALQLPAPGRGQP
jgi:DNA-binding SARP family transcriptional activator/TolB-like protein